MWVLFLKEKGYSAASCICCCCCCCRLVTNPCAISTQPATCINPKGAPRDRPGHRPGCPPCRRLDADRGQRQHAVWWAAAEVRAWAELPDQIVPPCGALHSFTNACMRMHALHGEAPYLHVHPMRRGFHPMRTATHHRPRKHPRPGSPSRARSTAAAPSTCWMTSCLLWTTTARSGSSATPYWGGW